jgi:hypothetical protein
MANPYGIEQVDVPGILAAYDTGRARRVAILSEQMHMRQMEASLNHSNAILDISRRLAGNIGGGAQSAVSAYGSSPADPSTPPAASTPIPPSPASALASAYDSAPPVAAPSPSGPLGSVASSINALPSDAPAGRASAGRAPALAAPGLTAPTVPATSLIAPDPVSRVQSNAGLLSQLAVLDPQHATSLTDALSKMDKAEVDSVHDRNQALGLVAEQLLGMPLAQRAEALRELGPDLVAKGLPAHMLEGADLSDTKLQYYVQEARDIEHVIESHRQDRNTDSEIQRRNSETAIGWDRNRIDEANNVRTTDTSAANNIRTTGTSAANNQRSTNASMANRRFTPAAVGVDASGHTAIVYPDNRVVDTTMRPVSSTRGRGRLGGANPGGTDIVPGSTHVNPSTGQTIAYSTRAGGYIDTKTGQKVK